MKRNIRRDSIDHLKKTEKEEHISEDDRKHGELEVQKLTDKFIKEIDELIVAKEKEIMEVLLIAGYADFLVCGL